MFQPRRVYQYQAGSATEVCILVDRLWPRGISKDRLRDVQWWKDIAPSDELRCWFGHDPERWTEFKCRYFSELDQHAARIDELRALGSRHPVILLYAAKDETHNHAAALCSYLASQS